MTFGLPDVIFAGPAKTGTTWIHEYLSERDCVALPATSKETFFFDRYFERGIDWYSQQFAKSTRNRCQIEVAPSYSDFPETAGRIARALPNVHIVLTFRDPVARTISQYWHWRRYGYTTKPIEELLLTDPLLLRPSRYASILENWHSIFGEERVSFMFFDDLAADPLGFTEKLCRLIGIPPQTPSAALLERRANKAAAPVSTLIASQSGRVRRFLLDNDLGAIIRLVRASRIRSLFEKPVAHHPTNTGTELRRRIYMQLRDDIEALEKKAGRDLASWHANA